MSLCWSEAQRDVERKMYTLMRQEALRRVGVFCRLTEWMGGPGTYGWLDLKIARYDGLS